MARVKITYDRKRLERWEESCQHQGEATDSSLVMMWHSWGGDWVERITESTTKPKVGSTAVVNNNTLCFNMDLIVSDCVWPIFDCQPWTSFLSVPAWGQAGISIRWRHWRSICTNFAKSRQIRVQFLMHVQMQITCRKTDISTQQRKALNLFITISQPDKVE